MLRRALASCVNFTLGTFHLFHVIQCLAPVCLYWQCLGLDPLRIWTKTYTAGDLTRAETEELWLSAVIFKLSLLSVTTTECWLKIRNTGGFYWNMMHLKSQQSFFQYLNSIQSFPNIKKSNLGSTPLCRVEYQPRDSGEVQAQCGAVEVLYCVLTPAEERRQAPAQRVDPSRHEDEEGSFPWQHTNGS